MAVLLIDKGALYLKYERLNKTQITMGVVYKHAIEGFEEELKRIKR